jgi:hypothetical protein
MKSRSLTVVGHISEMDSEKFLSHDYDYDYDPDHDHDHDHYLHMNAWSICSKRRQFKVFKWSVGQGQYQNAIRK